MSQRNTDRSSLQESHPSEDSGVSLRDARRWGWGYEPAHSRDCRAHGGRDTMARPEINRLVPSLGVVDRGRYAAAKAAQAGSALHVEPQAMS
jgi:hypothetical protein